MATGLMLYRVVAPVTELAPVSALLGHATFMLADVLTWNALIPAFGQPGSGLMTVAKALMKA